MTRYSTLRYLDDSAWRQRQALTRLMLAGHSARLVAADERQRYLRLRVEAGGWGFDALLALESWLGANAPELAMLAWDTADQDYLLDLFSAATPTLNWPLASLGAAQTRALELCGARGPMLALDSPLGEVLCADLPPALWPAPGLAPWCAALPLRLDVLLGRQILRPALLAEIAQGDVLLLANHQPQLACNGRALFSYTLQEEHIMVQPHFNLAASSLPASDAQGLEQVPLAVEFVLQEIHLTLGELGAIAPGQVLRLNPDAERNVVLRANGIVLARGELVELDQQLGIEIHSIVLGA